MSMVGGYEVRPGLFVEVVLPEGTKPIDGFEEHRNQLQKLNNCHNPKGEGGGQFCSAVEVSTHLPFERSAFFKDGKFYSVDGLQNHADLLDSMKIGSMQEALKSGYVRTSYTEDGQLLVQVEYDNMPAAVKMLTRLKKDGVQGTVAMDISVDGVAFRGDTLLVDSVSAALRALRERVSKYSPDQPRDEAGRWTDAPWMKTGEEYLSSQKTGHIESKAYEQYSTSEGIASMIRKPDYPELVKTLQVKGKTVELRRDRNPLHYTKTVQTTLSDGTPWDEIVRDEHGMAVMMTDEEAKAKGLPTESADMAAFVGDTPVAFASNEFGSTGIWVVEDMQHGGLGTELLYQFHKLNPNLASHKIGQMTVAGENLTQAYHRKLVAEAAKEGKPVPQSVLDDVSRREKVSSLYQHLDKSYPLVDRDFGIRTYKVGDAEYRFTTLSANNRLVMEIPSSKQPGISNVVSSVVSQASSLGIPITVWGKNEDKETKDWWLTKGFSVVEEGNDLYTMGYKAVKKYDPDQPRDDHGRWTDASPHVFGSKTKGTVTVSPAPSYKLHHEAAASVFASMKPEYRVADASFSLVPTKEGTSLEDAKGLLGPGCEGLTDARDHKTELYMDEPTMQDVEHFKAVVAHEYGHSVDAEIGSYLAGVAMGDAYISRHPHFAEVVWADLEKWRVPEGYSVPGKYSYALTAPQEMFAEAYAAVVIGHSAGSDEFVKDFPRTVKAVKFLLTSYRKGAQVDA
jgi:hypothetical protein